MNTLSYCKIGLAWKRTTIVELSLSVSIPCLKSWFKPWCQMEKECKCSLEAAFKLWSDQGSFTLSNIAGDDLSRKLQKCQRQSMQLPWLWMRLFIVSHTPRNKGISYCHCCSYFHRQNFPNVNEPVSKFKIRENWLKRKV